MNYIIHHLSKHKFSEWSSPDKWGRRKVLNLNQFRNWIWWVFWGKFNELFGHVQLKTKTVEVKAKWVSDRVNFYCAQIISTQCNCTANTPKWVKWEEVCAFFPRRWNNSDQNNIFVFPSVISLSDDLSFLRVIKSRLLCVMSGRFPPMKAAEELLSSKKYVEIFVFDNICRPQWHIKL